MVRRIPLLAVLLSLIVTVGVLSTTLNSSAPQLNNSQTSLQSNVESSAFYCAGLTSAKQGAQGLVAIVNTSRHSRQVTYVVSNETSTSSPVNVMVPARQTVIVNPETVLSSVSGYGVSAEVEGGGVFGEERIVGSVSQVRCSSSGVTQWFDAGLNTQVGAAAYVSVLNPTATPAVFDLTAFNVGGYAAPQPFQGVAIPAHREVLVDLSSQIVNSQDIGVRIRVLRGSVVASGVQLYGSTASLSTGVLEASPQSDFALVATKQGASSTIEVTNPTSQLAQVSMKVNLGNYQIAPQQVEIQPYSSSHVVITPNPAIPAAGEANVLVTSNVAVVTSLTSGTAQTLLHSSAVLPTQSVVALGQGGADIEVANATNKTLAVTIAAVGGRSVHVSIAGGQNVDVSTQFAWVRSDIATLITADKPGLLVNQLAMGTAVPLLTNP